MKAIFHFALLFPPFSVLPACILTSVHIARLLFNDFYCKGQA